MKRQKFARFLRFLRRELSIPAQDIRLALRHPERSPAALPMILWQYGFVSLSQLNQIFEWLEQEFADGMYGEENISSQVPQLVDL